MSRSIRRILVAVKEPGAPSPAVAKAAQIAAACGAELELFHAIHTPVYLDGFEGASALEIERDWSERSRKQLETIAGRLRRQGVRVSIAVEWDYPVYEAIVRRAARIRADLIVAARHDGRHTAPWLLRLTDWELLRLAPVPLLLVKSARPYRQPAILAAVDPTREFAKPAKLDRDILQVSETLTEALNGTLHAVHAYQLLLPALTQGLAAGFSAPPPAPAGLERTAAAAARRGFERVLEPVTLPKPCRHLVAGSAADAISQVARKTRAAIVVMGAISRSGLKRLFIGNTAERVLDVLPCDLLIVKPAHFASHVQRAPRGAREMVVPVPL